MNSSGAIRLGLLVLGCAATLAAEPYRPVIAPGNFTRVVNNPYFPLQPGTTSTFLEQDGRERRENKIAVTHATKTILGVKCVVVHDTVTLGGGLREDTFEWYAQDKQGAVWCFGSATREFKSGGRVLTTGSWEAGVDGAQPGIVMPARPKTGDRFRQGFMADVAEDICQIAALDEAVTVPAGSFKGCVQTREWSMLESGTSKKWFARGVGLVRAESTDGEVSTLLTTAAK